MKPWRGTLAASPPGTPIRFSLAEFLYWIAVLCILLSHVKLSYPAMICRGNPPLAERDLLALFMAPAFVGIPALFGSRAVRSRGVVVMSIGMGFTYGIVLTNLNSVRPHWGHVVGAVGLAFGSLFEVLIRSIVPTLELLVTLYFFERVTGDVVRCLFWRPIENGPT